MVQRNCRVCNKFFSPRWKKQLQCSTKCSHEASKRGLPKVRDGKPPRRKVRTMSKEQKEEKLLKKYEDAPEVLQAVEKSDELRKLILSQISDDRNQMASGEFSGMYSLNAFNEEIAWLETKAIKLH